MTKLKLFLLFFLLSPCFTFSQSAIIKNLYPTIKHHHKTDTIKNTCYPVVLYKSKSIERKVNAVIRSVIFGIPESDTGQSSASLLNALHIKYKGLGLDYTTNLNKNGFLSITIRMTTFCEDESAPIYLNFDLTTGSLISLSTMLNTYNDSISMRQAIVPPFADSVRLFELTLDKNNPKYSDIIQGLNNNIGNFSHNYIYQFILTEQELIFYFDCILPNNILNYSHRYKISFRLKTLRNVLKPEIARSLLN